MTVPLTNGKQSSVTHRCAVLLHPIVASDIPGVNSGIIRRLQSASPGVAFREDAIAIRAVHQLATPCGHTAVPVSEMRLASSQELVRQLEIEVVADTLENGRIPIALRDESWRIDLISSRGFRGSPRETALGKRFRSHAIFTIDNPSESGLSHPADCDLSLTTRHGCIRVQIMMLDQLTENLRQIFSETVCQ